MTNNLAVCAAILDQDILQDFIVWNQLKLTQFLVSFMEKLSPAAACPAFAAFMSLPMPCALEEHCILEIIQETV